MYLRSFLCCWLTSFLLLTSAAQSSPVPPNVLLIITDDQGYGDFGFTGNEVVRTPVLDSLARSSIRFTNFYVSPVCAPTRASLMTGRYSLRTGVRDTYNGGAIMATEEITIAEMLRAAGYRTGIFGKWHLGDNYPSRPIDQGFDESVVHLSGGMGQVGDITTYFRGDSSYFDPVLWHNGQREAYQGYCSDVFTDEALRFIAADREQPFFCYLSFNAPHTPLQVPERYYAEFADRDPTIAFAKNNVAGRAMSERDREDARRVYAMVRNIDDNVGRVLAQLRAQGIDRETIVIFLTDNGPQQLRYVGGLRGLKGSVYRGGVRVPFLLHYPGLPGDNRDIATPTAHIDILPTLADLCGIDPPRHAIDGHSLVPLLRGQPVSWAHRPLFFYWTRRYPERYENIALQRGRYKLVSHTDYNAPLDEFALYDLTTDPGEQQDILRKETGRAQLLKADLDSLYRELTASPHLLDPPRIGLGTPFENPVILNRNDAGGERGIWAQEEIFGKWDVRITPGYYRITFQFIKPVGPGDLLLETGPIVHRQANPVTTDRLVMESVKLPALTGELIPFYRTAGRRIFPFWVEVEKLD